MYSKVPMTKDKTRYGLAALYSADLPTITDPITTVPSKIILKSFLVINGMCF